ncbi:hypothetical protein BS639_17165 [Rouxiella silvae]|uniref:Bacteriophage protein n=1 Tax=Rouxiella silvae TaxID=1646373 RepID=A0ABX3TXU0_9GAMM|nr:hypothetical protein [Rouxiella silvae]ORJ20024.1 hypothetical protein BS639_17165 [Rouxiella silvae]
MKSGLTVRLDNSKAILDALKTIGNRDVLVGIPQSADERPPEEGEKPTFGNAAIGYINEKGSPAQNIPPRPHLEPGVQSVQPQTVEKLKAAALAVLEGNSGAAERALESAGIIASQAVKRYMTITGFTPLADSTLAARARRGRKGAAKELESRAAGNDPDNANARPLIDTGEYRNSITYVVRAKNAKS